MFCIADCLMQFTMWEAPWIDWRSITGFPKLKTIDQNFDETIENMPLINKVIINVSLMALFGF